MRHLFSCRHGNYNEFTDRLNSDGEAQIRLLAESISIIINDIPYLVSSTAPRAIDSAKILAEYFNLKSFDRETYLWCGSDAPEEFLTYEADSDRNKLIKMVNDRKANENLIIVSHKFSSEDLAYEVLNSLGIDYKCFELKYGEAVHIDFEKRVHKFIP